MPSTLWSGWQEGEARPAPGSRARSGFQGHVESPFGGFGRIGRCGRGVGSGNGFWGSGAVSSLGGGAIYSRGAISGMLNLRCLQDIRGAGVQREVQGREPRGDCHWGVWVLVCREEVLRDPASAGQVRGVERRREGAGEVGAVVPMPWSQGESFQVGKVVDQLSHCPSGVHTWAGDPVPTPTAVSGHLRGTHGSDRGSWTWGRVTRQARGPQAGVWWMVPVAFWGLAAWPAAPFWILTQTALGFLMDPLCWAAAGLGLLVPQSSLCLCGQPGHCKEAGGRAWTPRRTRRAAAQRASGRKG